MIGTALHMVRAVNDLSTNENVRVYDVEFVALMLTEVTYNMHVQTFNEKLEDSLRYIAFTPPGHLVSALVEKLKNDIPGIRGDNVQFALSVAKNTSFVGYVRGSSDVDRLNKDSIVAVEAFGQRLFVTMCTSDEFTAAKAMMHLASQRGRKRIKRPCPCATSPSVH